MAVLFTNENYIRAYDTNYVKSVYNAKQDAGANVVSAIEKAGEAPEDSVVISRAMGRCENYFIDFAKDHIEGRITQDEFYSHMEDLFYGYGMYHEDATLEQKQFYFETITQQAYSGVLDYYLRQNADEWKLKAGDAQFYYNSDYHYAHLEQIPSFLDGVEVLANKLGVEANLGRYNKNVLTVNGRMAAMLGTKCGSLNTLDEVPPPGMKMTLYTSYEPYTAKVECDGIEYTTGIPFSYDEYAFRFELSDLLRGFDIPERFMCFIKNISVINEAISRLYSANVTGTRTHGVSKDIFSEIENYGAIAKRAIGTYETNATEKLFFADL